MIVSALPVDKNFKLEFHLKIFFPAVEPPAETDATEVILQEPGTFSTKQVSSLDIFTTIPNGAVHMLSLLAIIMSMVGNMDPVELLNLHHIVIRHAKTLKLMLVTNGSLIAFTAFLLKFQKSKLKS